MTLNCSRSMHRVCVVLLALLVAVPFAMAQEPRGADIEFQTKVVELGTLSRDDDKQMVRLAFTNTGDVPLVVTEVRTSCTCTTVQHDRKKVLPGERGVLTITFDPSKAPVGSLYRVLQVFSTARSGVQHITLKAEIE